MMDGTRGLGQGSEYGVPIDPRESVGRGAKGPIGLDRPVLEVIGVVWQR